MKKSPAHKLFSQKVNNICKNLSLDEKKEINDLCESEIKKQNNRKRKLKRKCLAILSFLIVLCSIFTEYYYNVTASVKEFLDAEPCLLEPNSIPSEFTRPIVNCSLCSSILEIPTFDGHIPEDEAEKLAFSILPFVVKNATKNWKASREFSFDFFRRFFSNKTVLDYFEACQFLDFGSGFFEIEKVFEMPKARAETGKPEWYIGFSSCDEYVNENILREYFTTPEFIPKSLNTQQVWLFMGFGRDDGSAAPVHIDQVGVPSWQAQIVGKKTWRIYPSFECERECKHFEIVLETGDIFVIDTNWWYHSTKVEKDHFSLTIGSEYQ